MPATKLVVVESPAKAKTIASYLGPDYEVLASIGHIRDLHNNGKTLPEEHRKKWWAEFSTDVDNGFEPFYTVSDRSRDQVRKLKAALKDKDTLILATDEDREGESISWHLLDELKPPKKMKVQRIAFHEITRDAILRAIREPRDIDSDLVEAQEARRILDRLYGYSVSPVLWRLVQRGTSAGRVQSPAVKLVVQRERERREFTIARYWDLRAEFRVAGGSFSADLREIGGRRVANGSDFEPTTGLVKTDRQDAVVHLDAEIAGRLVEPAREATYRISRLEQKESQRKPAPPFMTTTLQQEANRKLNFNAERTMRIAQSLYEGVTIGGEQTGLITYMRTDSLSLGKDAVAALRDHIGTAFPDCLPDKPNAYASKVKNAQEAHEAIRPTDVARTPDAVRRYLSDEQARLYELIWKRAVASQMKNARVLGTTVDVDGALHDPFSFEDHRPAESLRFRATGTQVLFDGFLRLYREGRDDDADEGDRILPPIVQDESARATKMGEVEHATAPPARYTDATLVKRLEELGIGRPSTYASIISVIRDRGYVRMQGKQLVPTYLAFLTMEVLEGGFGELVDLGFTARMDDGLDEIAAGKKDRATYLTEFFNGDENWPGLKPMVEKRRLEIPFPNFDIGTHPETGEPIVVRLGKGGDPFLQIGEGEGKRYASVPEDLPPADLTLEKAIELLENKSAPKEGIGFHPTTGRQLLLKNKGGYYLEVERTPEEVERKEKPIFVSVPQNVDPHSLTQEDLDYLCRMPIEIGKDEKGEPITFRLGKYGPYLEAGAERRTVEDWTMGRSLTVEKAQEILAQPKGRPVRQAAAPLKEFGELPGAAGPVRVLSGRFGPYVTDGETNATLPKAITPTDITAEQAAELLANKRAAGPSVKKAPARKTAPKKAVAKKAPAKKKA